MRRGSSPASATLAPVMARRATSRPWALLPATALAAVAAVGAPAAAAAPMPGVPLSNERTVTWWAHPLEQVAVRSAPTARAPVRARLRMRTEDGFPEVYVALHSAVAADG